VGKCERASSTFFRWFNTVVTRDYHHLAFCSSEKSLSQTEVALHTREACIAMALQLDKMKESK
jgi:hypothetical protein